MSYQIQRAYADSFNQQLSSSAEEFIYSQRLLELETRLSTKLEDQRQGTDAVTSANPITWAYRVRKPSAERYFHQEATLRYREFDKLLSGSYADYMIYGLEDQDSPLKLAKVKLLDMNLAAQQIRDDENLKDKILATEVSYSGSQNSFLCLRYSYFPEPIEIQQLDLRPFGGLSASYPSQPIAEYSKAPRISLKPPSWAS